MDENSLAHTKWNCKYHVVFAPKFRRRVIFNQLKVNIGKIIRCFAIEKESQLLKQKYAQIMYIC